MRLSFAYVFVLWVGLVSAGEISGIVSKVQDGDSLTLATRVGANIETYKIRLIDIDAPEWRQKGGKDSRASLFHMCGLRSATAQTAGEDRYGRTLARVTCAGMDANAEQGAPRDGLGVHQVCAEEFAVVRHRG